MIRYALLCSGNHAFEAWFRDSEAFDVQSEAGLVCCPDCGRAEVRKAVMAPAVRRSAETGRAAAPAPEAETPAPPAPVRPEPAPAPVSDEAFAAVRAAMREIHAKLKRDAVDVGPAFPEQARAIHEGEAPVRAIYGTATDEEVRSLVEDGVGIMPIPALPDDRN